MTNRDFFNAVIGGISNDEVIAKANELLAGLDAKNDKRRVANATKKAEANEPLIAKAIEVFANANEPLKASDIAKVLEVSTSKATVIAKAVPNIVIDSVKVKGGRVVKTYTLA